MVISVLHKCCFAAGDYGVCAIDCSGEIRIPFVESCALMFHEHRTAHWSIHVYRTNGPVRLGRRTPELDLSVLGRFFSTGNFVFEQVSPGYIMHVVESGEGTMEMNGI